MPSLIQRARSYIAIHRQTYVDITEEEVELYLAYLDGEVTFGQVRHALDRSYGYATNWCRRVADHLYRQGKLVFSWRDMSIRWKPRTYQEYQEKSNRLVKA